MYTPLPTMYKNLAVVINIIVNVILLCASKRMGSKFHLWFPAQRVVRRQQHVQDV